MKIRYDSDKRKTEKRKAGTGMVSGKPDRSGKTDRNLFAQKFTGGCRAALEILYPSRCPFCNEIVREEGGLICRDCLMVVRDYYEIREPVCYLCGKELKSREEEFCAECLRYRRSFDGGVSLFRYGRMQVPPVPGRKPGFEKHSIGDSILRFKYYNCRGYGEFYIAELMEQYQEKIDSFHADVIIPVPVHPARERFRGYNQAKILAENLGKLTGIPVETGLLVRDRKTKPQKGLGDSMRLKNLEQAFDITGPAPKQIRTAILIDDILTTGSTMEACTRKLKSAGILRVYCVSICSGQQ